MRRALVAFAGGVGLGLVLSLPAPLRLSPRAVTVAAAADSTAPTLAAVLALLLAMRTHDTQEQAILQDAIDRLEDRQLAFAEQLAELDSLRDCQP